MPDMLPYRPASATSTATSDGTPLDRLKWQQQQPQQGSHLSMSNHSYGNGSHLPASSICQYNRPTTVSSCEKGKEEESKQRQLSNHYTMLTSSSPLQKESTSASKKRKADRVHGGRKVSSTGDGIEEVGTEEKISIEGDRNETVFVVKPEVENQQSNDGSTKKGAPGESSKEDSKALAPKQDFIHVRARRGQATDSHSLAERVRREKISKRMRFLQDLVPGCKEITGKASMLDEIINYVQSLQKQVEFLSMKLASATPSIGFNAEEFFSKEIGPVSSTCPPVGMSCELVDLSHLPCSNFQQPVAGGGLHTALDRPELSSLRRAMSAPATAPEAFMDACYGVGGSSVAWDANMRGCCINVMGEPISCFIERTKWLHH